LTAQWPRNWDLIAHADDKARAERLERTRRQLVIDVKEGKQVPDFKEDQPWSACFRLLAQDDRFWDGQVRHPATAWLASGAKGAPMASAEALATAHYRGLSEGHEIETLGHGEKEDIGDARRTETSASPNESVHKLTVKS
jgi:hypothetical protein